MWSKLINRTGFRPADELYKLYGNNVFETLVVDKTIDLELSKFVEETNIKGPKFNNYTSEKLEQFVSRIYELRKNQSNNTAG